MLGPTRATFPVGGGSAAVRPGSLYHCYAAVRKCVKIIDIIS